LNKFHWQPKLFIQPFEINAGELYCVKGLADLKNEAGESGCVKDIADACMVSFSN
jgi:hypothetical protein